MLINLRNALMAGKRLPYDAEVEYLESTGTQYINTGIKPGPNTRVEIVFAMTTFTANCGLFGARGTASADNNSYNLFIISNSGARVRWDWSGSGQYQTTEAETSTAATYVLGAAGGNITRDGDTLMSVSSSKTSINYSLYIFNMNNVGSPFSTGANARVWSVKIYEGAILVHDYIPVRVGTTGELYDRVSGKFAERHGDFVVGQDVVTVEYLRGDGSSAIETDIQWQLKAAYTEVDFRMPDARDSVSKRLLGSSAASFNYITARRATRADYFGFNAATDPLLELVSGTQYKGAAWYENDLYNFSLNDSVATYLATVHGAAGSFCVFDVTRSSYEGTCFKGDISAVRIYADKTKAQLLNNLQAVRVGTDATSWEGAMMDTLTRRIYRNAGTGAFTYGNDLKYPIPAE